MDGRKDVTMNIKVIGAGLIVVGCGYFGFSLVRAHQKEVRTLSSLISILDYMECELQYRMTALPQLCRQAAAESSGILQKFFNSFSQELEDQISPDVISCMRSALGNCKGIPNATREGLELLGRSLGRFDLQGQLKGLEAVRQHCRLKLGALEENKEVRLRSYQTLFLCAGAAIAILLI